MQQTTLNTLDKNEPIDYDNLNIVIRPRPPRRRQSGISLIPFRPYVKCLTSVRQPFSFANGYDKWMTTGDDKIFFTQRNARCIGSLLDDCGTSDTIRWDIEAESTRLPMMCKLWMIVDGAVVERGKPHLVQDAAMQVYTTGRNLRAIKGSQQHLNETSNIARRRRHSWHEVNEYHSVPYYQYTCSNRNQHHIGIQCNIDNEHLISTQETLSDVEEEMIEDDEKIKKYKKEHVYETIHKLVPMPNNRVNISVKTQTERQTVDQSTTIDAQFLRTSNLHLETNEIILSPIVNPYRSASTSYYSNETMSFFYKNAECKHRSVSTGDDYPHWWLRLSTDLILSDYVTNQYEEKEKSFSTPSPRHDQSIQTDIDKSKFLSTSTSTSTSCSTVKLQNNETNLRQRNTSKHSETDYNSFVLTLNQQNVRSVSTPDHQGRQTKCNLCPNYSTRTRSKSSESTSTVLLTNLLERYERSLHERQRTAAIVNDQLLDIDDVLKYYRNKIEKSRTNDSTTAMELYRNISTLADPTKQEESESIILRRIREKYRSMPGITSQEMIQGYIPSPRVQLTNLIINSPRQRQPRYKASIDAYKRPEYCNLCLTDRNTSSAWIRYNERKIDELQKRIDLMLQIDDNEESKLLLGPNYSSSATVSQRIDDILRKKRSTCLNLPEDRDKTLTTSQYRYRLLERLNQSLPTTPRLTSRNTTRSTTPVSKTVRIATQSNSSEARLRKPRSTSRPLTSILRRSSVSNITPTTINLPETSHVWQSRVDGKVYVLNQFSIPRYYRLYNDVSFREMYNASRVLDTYLNPTDTAGKDYTSMVKRFALEHQLPSPITSAA